MSGGVGGTPTDIASVTISPWPRKKRNTHIACSPYTLPHIVLFSLPVSSFPSLHPCWLFWTSSPFSFLPPSAPFPRQAHFLTFLPLLPLSLPPSSPSVLPVPPSLFFLLASSHSLLLERFPLPSRSVPPRTCYNSQSLARVPNASSTPVPQ